MLQILYSFVICVDVRTVQMQLLRHQYSRKIGSSSFRSPPFTEPLSNTSTNFLTNRQLFLNFFILNNIFLKCHLLQHENLARIIFMKIIVRACLPWVW